MAGRAYASALRLDSVGNGLDADGVKLFCGAMGTGALESVGEQGYNDTLLEEDSGRAPGAPEGSQQEEEEAA
eukprot:9926221-Lingulodinium_polyedra.AAC.1